MYNYSCSFDDSGAFHIVNSDDDVDDNYSMLFLIQKSRACRYKVSWLNYGALVTFFLYRSLRSLNNEDVVVHSSVNRQFDTRASCAPRYHQHVRGHPRQRLQLSAAAAWLMSDSVVTQRSLKSNWWVQLQYDDDDDDDDDDDEATPCGPKYDDTSSYSTRKSILRDLYEDFIGL